MLNKLPLNIPKQFIYKYLYIIDKDYVKFINIIAPLGNYITFHQFQGIIKMDNPSLSDAYIKKKTGLIIKELQKYDFIGVDFINKNKYVYLKTPALAFYYRDYKKVPKINHLKSLKNDKFMISLMKVEHYLKTKKVITNKMLFRHLYFITNEIYNATLKDPNLDYNIKDIEFILKQKDLKNIQDRISTYKSNNLIRILWFDIASIFSKLLMQNQTIAPQPKYFKLFKVGNVLKLHYAPNIIIFDTHDIKYYSNKLSSLFEQFFSITDNETRHIQYNFKENKNLGFEGQHHIGYTISLLGYNLESLNKKILTINTFIKDNPHTPVITDVSYIYFEISRYLTHASHKNSTFANIDNYVDTQINTKLSELLKS